MSDLTKIEWCDATLNLWWGCTKVSDGCKFCYAERMSDQRYKRGAWGPKGTRTEVKSWRATLEKVSRRAKAENRRLRVFCQSMSDTFEGPETMGGMESENWRTVTRLREELGYEIQRHPHIDFLLLTKRPENVLAWVKYTMFLGNRRSLPDNLWLGTSVERVSELRRIDDLRNCPAAIRFLSLEPLLGDLGTVNLDGIHWVIADCESGPNARPMRLSWARSLRDQCMAANVPFFFKQWGEWLPAFHFAKYDEEYRRWADNEGRGMCVTEAPGFTQIREDMFRVGKHRAGRLLDGRTWDEFPGAMR